MPQLDAIRSPTPVDISRLLFVAALWGGSFVFISIALQDLGPVSIAAWRIFLGAVILLGVSMVMGQRFSRNPREWLCISLVGLLHSAVPFYLINHGQLSISSAESALLMSGGTFFSLVLAHCFNPDEKMNLARVSGVLTGFLGVIVLLYEDLVAGGLGSLEGQIAVLLAGCSYATSSIIARRVTHLPPLTTGASSISSAALYMVPLAFILEDPLPSSVATSTLVSIFYLGVLATALGMVIRLFIIKFNGSVFTSQVGYLVPVFGVFWSWIYFSDAIQTSTWISLGLIILGIGIIRKAN